MSINQFQVEQVDHIELRVPDQLEAAQWYRQIFGLEIIPEYEFWAQDGPLMISSDNGNTMLALFKGEPPGFKPLIGFQRVAFRVSGQDFFTFVDRLDDQPVYSHEGQAVNTLDIVDHERAFSVYFCDPYGNRYEVTTYDYEWVSNQPKK